MKGKKQTTPSNHSFSKSIIMGVNTILVLLLINIVSQNLAIIDYTFTKLITIFLLISLTIINFPAHLLQTSKNYTISKQVIQLLPGMILIFFTFSIVIFSTDYLLWMVSIPIILLGLIAVNKTMKPTIGKDLRILSIYTFIYTIFAMILTTQQFMWHLLNNISLYITKIFGNLIGTPMYLGPSISGFWILISFFIFFITLMLVIKNKKQNSIRFFISIISLFIIWILYLLLLSISDLQATVSAIQYHPLLFIFCLIPIYFFQLTINTSPSLSINIHPNFLSGNKKYHIVILIIVMFLATIFLSYLSVPSVSEKPTILWYGSNMVGDWEVPMYGTYGREAVGMFGLLPLYLNAMGCTNKMIINNITSFLNATKPAFQNLTDYVNLTDYFTFIETPYITKNLFDNVDIFIVINPNATFTIPEHKIIWEFVSQGGSLLVLGDHTNVGNIQQPLNALLSPVEISFRFDSALPIDQQFQWKTTGQLYPHILTQKFLRVQDIDISVGASLDVPSNSIPIVIGRYALSDIGDWSNQDFAYLGDYTYNSGEQLGDIVLVATTNYDDGKVLVFGDSSPFQNSALPFTHPFIQNVFTWLSTPSNHVAELIQPILALVLLLSAFFFYIFMKTPKPSIFPLPIIVGIALLITTFHPIFFYNPSDFQENIVGIDTSHIERFTSKSFTDQSLNGLMLSFQRNNLLPIILPEFDISQLSKTKIIVLNAPTKPFNQGELDFLHQYMGQGGVVILATSYEDKDASQQILNAYDLSIENIPLGPVPYVETDPEEYETEPRFVDSWPIQFNPQTTISFYNFTWNRDYHLITYTTVGLGGLLLISDSQFLYDQNIESLYDFWPGNIILLKHLIDYIVDKEEKL